jgi:hypothetical protein
MAPANRRSRVAERSARISDCIQVLPRRLGWLARIRRALQRGWRDFRMAQSSFERADPRCQKIGRRRLSRCREGTVESFR